MGEVPTLTKEVRALGEAMARPEDEEGYKKARQALIDASNEHAVLDVSGIIAWHSLISKVVDTAGFYSPRVPTIISKLSTVVIFARSIRDLLMSPVRFVTGWSKMDAKEKQG